MKPATLMLSAAVVSMMLFAPVAFPGAEAASIKIKPQIVKVKPKVTIAKPKIRVKVRTATIRIKPTVKVRVKPVTPKIVATRKLAPKVIQTLKVNPRPKVVVSPTIAVARNTQKVKVATPRTKPTAPVASGLANPAAGKIATSRIGDQRHLKDVMQAAAAADAARDVISLGKMRGSATPEFGLPMADLTRNMPTNQERLGKTEVPDRTGNMFPGDDLGGGSSGFVGLGNTGSGKQPANPWGVDTAGAINRAAKNGDGSVTLPVHNPKDTRTDQVYSADTLSLDATAYTMTIKNRADGSSTIIHDGFFAGVNDGEHIYGLDLRNVTEIDANGRVTEETHLNTHTTPSFEPVAPRTTRLTNPDYVEGSSTCRDINCIVRGEGTPKGLQYADVKDGKTQVNPGPDNAQPNGWASGSAVYTASDVLERYDEDGRNNTAHRPIDRDRVQSD